ncbi:MAG: glycosyltransferase, partial [Muribaculaceae bacterium]|nr:glycosyltransferase [Muribaculaceae bacterium]
VAVPAWVREPNKDLLLDLNDNGTVPVEPDYMTHRLNNEDSDPVTCRIRTLRTQLPQDNVKIIYIPCYLDGYDGIVNISYYDLLPAVDITVFPSYYEPWGYTPLESVAFSVPAVTTDKSGFGQWILSTGENGIFNSGVTVIPRDDDNYEASAREIAGTLQSYLNATPQQIADARKDAETTAAKADWHFFIKDYLKAFEIAMTHRNQRNKSEITK